MIRNSMKPVFYKKNDKMTEILIDSFICLPETRCCKNENDREFMSSSYSNALLYGAGRNYSKGA